MTQVETSIEQVFQRIDDAFFALDEDWRFTYLNDRATEMLDVDRAAVLGEVVWDEFEPAVGTTFQRKYEQALEDQEPVSFEEYYPPLERWFEVNAYPGEDGLSVYFRDVTERVERERELEWYETIVETVQDGIYTVDDGEFTMVNDAYAEMVGYDREELIGSDVSTVVEESTAAEAAEIERRLEEGDISQASIEATLERADGETFDAEATFAMLPDGQRVGVVRDITERRKRERMLGLYVRIIETVDDGVFAVDDDGEFILVNDGFCELTGYEREELIGTQVATIYDETATPKLAETAATPAETDWAEAEVEFELVRKDGERIPAETRVGRFDIEDAEYRCGVVRDIGDRKRFEERLVDLHGIARDLFLASDGAEVGAVATNALHDVLDAPAAGFYAYDSGTDQLVPEIVSDELSVVKADLDSVETGEGSITGRVFEEGETAVVDDILAHPSFAGLDDDVELGVRSGVFAPVGEYGVLLAGAPSAEAFSQETRQLVDLVATTTAAAFSRAEYERQLRSQRDRLAALNDIDSLVHRLSESMFGLSEREEIEQLVCDGLADSDSYEFTWIATQTEDGEISARAEAGVEDYLSTVDPGLLDTDKPGPTELALRTGELQVVQDVEDDPAYEPWRSHAEELGYSSSAAVPIVDGGEQFGTLNVYSSRGDAFDEEERDALRRLGSILAYAILSVRRDRELQRERNRLEFMNRLLRHNLLNDLNVVNARLDLLDGRVDYEMADHLDVARDRTEQMVEFVERVRDVTKVIGRGSDQELEPKPLDEVLADRVDNATDGYPEAEYIVDAVPSVSVVADDLLGDVLDNVLENAVQHNPGDEPTVWVDVEVDDDTATVVIEDDGPGVPDDQKSTIFDRGIKEFETPGSGFGLYLVKEILDSYGGEIAVEDREAGGARFLLTFERA